MNKIIVLAALVALSACSKSEPAPAPDATAEAAAPAPAAEVLAADGKSPVGNYKITGADGVVTTEEVRADGTYSSTTDGKPAETGKWVQKSPELYCYTKDEEGATEVCNNEKIDDKGVWITENPETKETATVERVES